ncbi:MAG: hypothetical protein HC819_09220 [Cyclobacteriaceae bacterium]|nr:hypothetical protein [Cyclobacteriaceae bacterium]
MIDVEKSRINILLHQPSKAEYSDIGLLETEIRKYPYAQFLRVLLAKVHFELDTSEKNQKLTSAAIYSADRSILKKIIQENGYLENIQAIEPMQDQAPAAIPATELKGAVAATAPIPPAQEESVPHQNVVQDSSSIFAEVLKNLEKLKALRQQFQFLELNDQADEVDTKVVSEAQNEKNITEVAESPKPTNPGKSQERESPTPKKTEQKKKKRDELWQQDELLDSEVNVFFLKEIEQKKESLERPATDKHLAQNEIIERFIIDQPSIGSVKKESDKTAEQINRDLADKSTRFNDELVSENLAIILLKQGKKERAVDIYKKLIWRLPQKKAYFAARIEEINK